jgi:hypothetical protein
MRSGRVTFGLPEPSPSGPSAQEESYEVRHPGIKISASFIASVTLWLAACQPAQLGLSPTQSAPSANASATAYAAETSSAAPSPSETSLPSASASASASATAATGEPFRCEPLDVRETADQAHALIADVRVGTHDGYDRFVVEFTQPPSGAPAGVPEYIVEVAQPPLQQDPSAQPMEVPGSHHVLVALLFGTKYDENFNLHYTGPTRFDPGFASLVAAYERGDFEATSSWYLGLTKDPCLRVFTLTDPMRLVIDIAH